MNDRQPAARGATALLELYDRGLPQVYGYLVSRCRSAPVAEDLTAETFLAAVDAARTRDEPLTVAWLIGVARHKLVDHWRRAERQQRGLRLAHDEAAAVDDPWDQQIDAMRAQGTLAGLLADHRAALTLRYMDGLSVPEVADQLGRTVHAAEALLVRARGAFRRGTAKGGPMADPFDALRQPIVPIDPRPEFVADLRGRLLRELGVTSTIGGPMTTTTPVRAHSLTPYICVNPADRALAFYADAFGAVETMRVVGPDGRVGHAEITIGSVRIMLSDEYPEYAVLSPTSLGGAGVALYLEVDDCDAAFERAVASGATSLREPEDQEHGSRMATISDPFGHRWMLSARIEDVSLEEYQRRSAAEGWETTGPRAPTRNEPTGQLGYYTFAVPDVDRGAAFYGSLFGWTFNPTVVGSDGVHRYGHVNNTTVPMGITNNMEGPTPHLFYRVTDLDGAIAKVRELGGDVVDVQEFPSGGNAHCRDDQGVEFYLWKPAPEYE